MDTSGVLSTLALIASAGGLIVGVINHKKIIVRCCGHRKVFAIDIEDTARSPPSPSEKVVIKAPPVELDRKANDQDAYT